MQHDRRVRLVTQEPHHPVLTKRPSRQCRATTVPQRPANRSQSSSPVRQLGSDRTVERNVGPSALEAVCGRSSPIDAFEGHRHLGARQGKEPFWANGRTKRPRSSFSMFVPFGTEPSACTFWHAPLPMDVEFVGTRPRACGSSSSRNGTRKPSPPTLRSGNALPAKHTGGGSG